MFFSYLKIAFRSLQKQPLYSFINITGLSLGVAMSVLILLFVVHEVRYDAFHQHAQNIFRMNAQINFGGQTIQTSAMSAGFGPLLARSSAEVKNYVRVREPGRVVVQSDADHQFFEDKFIFADSSFFSVFSFTLLKGSPRSLGQARNVLITPAMQQKYFGSEDPIGKTITYQNGTELEVVGIVAPAPSNSSITFDFIASFATLGVLPDPNEKSQYDNERAALGAYQTFLLLADPGKALDLQTAIPALAKTSVDETYLLQPLRGEPANSRYLKIFGSVAALVLLLALVNYMNLTTARGTLRAKEVGVRKVVGAQRAALSAQFYIESALLTAISFGVAYLMVSLALPFFLQSVGQSIDSSFLSSPIFLVCVLGLLAVCIFLAGSYPALVLSRFNPAHVLKGKQNQVASGTAVRKLLTIFQFTVSVALIICSLIVQDQLTFLRHQKIGLNRDQVLVVNLEGIGASFVGFRNDVQALSGVEGIGQASLSLFKDGGMAGFFTQTPRTKEDVFINVLRADPDFFKTLGIEWALRNRDTLKAGDWVVNEAGLAKLKLTNEDIGVPLKLMGDTGVIAGVVNNFNYASLREKIGGVLMSVVDYQSMSSLLGEHGSIYIRLNTSQDVFAQVKQIRGLYEKHKPTAPFESYFLDDAFNRLYQAEDRLATIFTAFTALAIVIACLGLFGLVTFTTERKTKEIGIRKVLGASVRAILVLVVREFGWIIAVSIAIATPLAAWSMEQWLSDFPYRIHLSWVAFGAAALIIVVLALGIILVQATRAASANPVDSLRSE